MSVWQTWQGPAPDGLAYEPSAHPPRPVNTTGLAACGAAIAGGVICWLTRKTFEVPCGAWQSRQVVDQAPRRLPVASAVWPESA